MPRYGVFEQMLGWKGAAANPWEDVSARVTLVSPSRRTIAIDGFYDGAGRWRFRFAPTEVGAWRWTAEVGTKSQRATYRGRFLVVKSGSPGIVRRSPSNPFRWVFTDGSPYYPIGLNDCTTQNNTYSPLAKWGFDGGFRPPGQHQGWFVSMPVYMRAYSRAGFNLFRWGPDNCSFSLYDRISPDGNVYSAFGGHFADLLFQTLRRHGFRIEMVLFGADPPPYADGGNAAGLQAVARYARYVVARWGAYVDFWELMNESTADQRWYEAVLAAIRQTDPYRHPIGTNYTRTSGFDFSTEHWYQKEDAHESDTLTWQHLQGAQVRDLRRPLLVDEQGNSGQNWDPGSALRMRIRSWTAFFAEGTFVFWNTSAAKDYKGGAANIYLGPLERSYVRVLQTFTRGFDARASISQPNVSPGNAVRAYGLRGPRGYALYLVATGDRNAVTAGVRVAVEPERVGTGRWIDPASGRIVGTVRLKPGKQTVTVPPFLVDLALELR